MDIAQITKILKIISKSTEKPLLKSKSMGIAKKSYSNTPQRLQILATPEDLTPDPGPPQEYNIAFLGCF